MQVNIHAIVLLVLPLVSLVAMVFLPRQQPSSRQVIAAIGYSLGLMALACLSNQHLCREGTPTLQWFIPGVFMIPVLAVIKSRTWRRVLGAILAVGMLGLSCHFTEVVHTDKWTGSPYWDGYLSAFTKSLRQSASVALENNTVDTKQEYPPAWLHDLPAWNHLKPVFTSRQLERREISHAWHTRFTGLYRVNLIAQDFWYPGGSLAEGIQAIEPRDRLAP